MVNNKCIIKLISIIIFLLLISTSVFAQTNYAVQESRLKAAITLGKLGIVDDYDKFDETDYISRRDFFDMIYRIVRHPGGEFNGSFEEYCDDFMLSEYGEDPNISIKQSIEQAKRIEEKIGKNIYTITRNFIDIDETSEDYVYWYAWTSSCIASGKFDDNGNYYADLDGYVTNYEAIKTLCNMFYLSKDSNVATYDWDKYMSDYFQFAEDIGLINHQTPIENSCTFISRDDLNEKISAYDCMNLVYYSLYIPTYTHLGKHDMNFRLIERYFD